MLILSISEEYLMRPAELSVSHTCQCGAADLLLLSYATASEASVLVVFVSVRLSCLRLYACLSVSVLVLLTMS